MRLRQFAFLTVLIPATLFAQQQPGQQPAPARPQAVAPSGAKQVIEEIVARVNNEIITLTDYERARVALRSETEQDCPGCPAAQIQTMLVEREKNLLRDLIDNSLLVQRAKDLGFNVEPEVVKRMDAIRLQNNLEDMEALCRAVEATGISCEEWKANIRSSLLTQEVIRREVGRNINFSKEEIQKYYDEHKAEFVRPEQVYLLEMFVSTEGKPEAEIPKLEEKAKTLLDRVKNRGEDFAELAKRYSDGSTAQRGGELGVFERGQLSKELEDVAFAMNRGDVSEIIRTKTGFLILKCEQHYVAGQQPIDKVENEIMNKLYMDKMQPGLRVYLTKLREESYVVVKPGFEDAAQVASQPIVEVEQTPESQKDKDKGKKKKDKKPAE